MTGLEPQIFDFGSNYSIKCDTMLVCLNRSVHGAVVAALTLELQVRDPGFELTLSF